MTKGLIIGYTSPEKQWLIEQGYMKHPQDKAQRLYINEKKKRKKTDKREVNDSGEDDSTTKHR